MLNNEVLESCLRILLILVAPVTGVVLGLSLIGSAILGVFGVRDEVVLYAVRLVGTVLVFVLLSSVISRFMIAEVRTILSSSFVG